MGAQIEVEKRTHIVALDLTRVVVVALVVAVHTLAIGAGKLTAPLGAFIMVFHSSREVFFLLTAFVLTYNYGRRPIRWAEFWRRRYGLVVPAYVAWTVIYFFADGKHLDPISSALAGLGHDLLTADARYQLYFLLVTMQLYLAFPLLRRLLQKTARHHIVLFLSACVYELALTYAIEYHAVTTGPISAWLRSPDALLPSYALYVIAGALGGWHFDRFASFTRDHLAVVATALFIAIAGAISIYFAEIFAIGQSPTAASAVFQPAVVTESLAIAWALFAAGLVWAEKGAPHRRVVSTGADSTFGIFLAHPLVLQGALALAGTTGVLADIRHAPAGFELAELLCVGVPVIYGVSGLLVFLARRGPLSLILTGRQVWRDPARSALRARSAHLAALSVQFQRLATLADGPRRHVN